MRRAARIVRRGFTLTESVVVIVVVALAVPGLMVSVRWQDLHSVDRERRMASAWLASAVLETVLADAASEDNQLGFENIDAGMYLNHPVRGLYVRLEDVAEGYASRGIGYSVGVGEPIDLSGAPASADDPWALREIVVTVSFVDHTGEAREATFRTIVSNTR